MKHKITALFVAIILTIAVLAQGEDILYGKDHDFRGMEDRFEPKYDDRHKPPIEEMIYGKLFRHIDEEINPREMMDKCTDPESIVDLLMQKLKDEVGDFTSICDEFAEDIAECEERVKKDCERIGIPHYEDYDEIRELEVKAWGCPPDQEAMIEVCILRSIEFNKERAEYIDEICEQRWEYSKEKLLPECEQQKEYLICDKEEFIQNCLGPVKEEDFIPPPETYEEQPYMEKPIEEQPVVVDYYGSLENLEAEIDNIISQGLNIGLDHYDRMLSDLNALDISSEDYNRVKTKLESIKPDDSDIIALKNLEAEIDNLIAENSKIGDDHYYRLKNQLDSLNIDSSDYIRVITKLDSIYDPGPTADEIELEILEKGEIDVIIDQGPEIGLDHYDRMLNTLNSLDIDSEDYERVRAKLDSIKPEPVLGDITGSYVFDTFEGYRKYCEEEYEQHIAPQCTGDNEFCSKEGFIHRCIRNEKESMEAATGEIKIHCKMESNRQLQEAQYHCKRMEEDKKRCFEEGIKHCGEMNVYEECKESLEESKIRAHLRQEVDKRCHLMPVMFEKNLDENKLEVVVALNRYANEEEIEEVLAFLEHSERLLTLENSIVFKGIIDKDNIDELKSLSVVQKLKIDNMPEEAGQAALVKRIAKKLIDLRDEELPEDIVYMVESEAADISDVSDDVGELEEIEEKKNFGYKFRRFFGLMKKAEEQEVAQLQESKEKLVESIKSLKAAAAKVDDPMAKAVLLEQVEELEVQLEDMDALIESKLKKSKGIFSFLFK